MNAPRLPETIGRFKIVNRIAQGGMGALYLAWDPTLERQIAIKLLRDDNEEMRERFSREARSVARLRHPRIVTIFDVGEYEGQPFIAMEYIQGRTLAQVIETSTPMPVAVKLRLIEELCDGLGFAHRAGIIHRDVKPANLIVDTEGSLKILDFGIARVGPGMTHAGMLIGTLNYMSPEQVIGKTVDQRSDIFAVGGVLYELLAYRQAFAGTLDTGILNKILHEEPEPLPSVVPGLDDEIATIVHRALEKRPVQRYQDMDAMRRDLLKLRQQLEGTTSVVIDPESPTALTPTPRNTPSLKTSRREPDRSALERRRAAQIDAHLEKARSALAAGEHEAAIASCEEALLLDAEHPSAIAVLDEVNAALEAKRAQQYLEQAQAANKAGDLATALELVQQALDLGEGSGQAAALKAEIEAVQQQRERERERRAALRKALERARQLFEEGAFDDAASFADQALAIDPNHPSAASLRGRAVAAAEAERQQRLDDRATKAVTAANALFSARDYDGAFRLLNEFTPKHEKIDRGRESLSKSLAEIDERVDQQVQAVSTAMRAGELEQAQAIIREALAVRPSHEQARAVEAELENAFRERAAQRELEERRARERKAAAAAALDKASKTPSHAAALELIREAISLDPGRDDARVALEQRTAAHEQELAAERRRQEVASIRNGIAALLDKNDLDGAERALGGTENSGDLQSALEPLRYQLEQKRAELARRELEAKRAAEKKQAIADALDRAERALAHEVAIAAYRQVLELDSTHAAAKQGLAVREAALQRERAIATGMARAAQAATDADAVTALRDVLAISPEHADATRQLRVREAAVAKQAAEAARLRAKQEAVDRGLRKAAQAPSHAEAVAALREVLEIEPNHSEARRLLETRENAARAEEAARQRAQEIEAARDRIQADIARGDLGAAEQALAALESASDAAKVAKPLRRALEKQRATVIKKAPTPAAPTPAAAPAPAGKATRSDAPTRRWGPGGFVWIGTAAVVLVAVLGYALLRKPAPSIDQQAAAPVTQATPPAAPVETPAPGPSTPPATPPPAAAPPEPVTLPPPAATQAPPAASAPPPAPRPAPDATADVERRVAPFRTRARQDLAQGNRRQAVASIASGLAIRSDDPELKRLLAQLQRDAATAVQNAHDAAESAGVSAASSAQFREAGSKEQESRRARRPDESVIALLDAAALYAQAAEQARTAPRPQPTTTVPPTIAQATPPAQAPPVPAPTPQTPPPGRVDQPPLSPVERPSPPAARPAPAAPPPPSPATIRAAEEAAIREVLNEYAAAYSSLNSAAVQRVQPSVDAATLQRSFSAMRSQALQILNPRITVNDTTATVTTNVKQVAVPKVGSRQEANLTVQFTLRKTANGWIITERR